MIKLRGCFFFPGWTVDHDVKIGPSYPQLLEVVSEGSRNVGVWVGFTNNKEDVWIVKIVGS